MFHRSAVFSCRICFLVHLTIRSSESDRQSESYRAIEREPEKDPKPLDSISYGSRIIHSERDVGMSPGAVQVWFHRLYSSLGFAGASSHSGRRSFITRCAKKIVEAGGSLRDVQELAGHASLATTQRYIQGDTDAKRRVVDL